MAPLARAETPLIPGDPWKATKLSTLHLFTCTFAPSFLIRENRTKTEGVATKSETYGVGHTSFPGEDCRQECSLSMQVHRALAADLTDPVRDLPARAPGHRVSVGRVRSASAA